MIASSQALQNSARIEYQVLHNALSNARECCIDGKDADLRHKAEQVQDVLTALDRDDICSRTADFEAANVQIAAVNADMQVLKTEIDKVVQDVAVAAKVVSAIDGAASAAGKMFA